MLRHRAFLLCVVALLSSIVVLHCRGMQIYGLSNLFLFRDDPGLQMSNAFFAVSMIFAAYWALSAPSRELLWLWISLPLLAVVHFCSNTLLPFYWLADSKRIYFSEMVGYFGYMALIAIGAHSLHLLLRHKYFSVGERNE